MDLSHLVLCLTAFDIQLKYSVFLLSKRMTTFTALEIQDNGMKKLINFRLCKERPDWMVTSVHPNKVQGHLSYEINTEQVV